MHLLPLLPQSNSGVTTFDPRIVLVCNGLKYGPVPEQAAHLYGKVKSDTKICVTFLDLFITAHRDTGEKGLWRKSQKR